MNRGDNAVYDGYEVCLWPLEYISITANPYNANHIVNGVSNSGLYDNGWYITNIRELYAPVTMELINSYPTGSINGHTQVWRSVDKVWIPSLNEPTYITIGFSHSDTLPYTALGTVVKQGTHFYNTGTYGIGEGAHVHMILYIGRRTLMFPTGYCSYLQNNIWYSDNPPNEISDMFYILDTDVIVRDGGYNWTLYEGEITKDKHLLAILYLNLNKRRKRHGTKIYT